MRKLPRPGRRPLPPEFHSCADYCVVGVFVLELLRDTTLVLTLFFALGALVLAIFFGGES